MFYSVGRPVIFPFLKNYEFTRKEVIGTPAVRPAGRHLSEIPAFFGLDF